MPLADDRIGTMGQPKFDRFLVIGFLHRRHFVWSLLQRVAVASLPLRSRSQVAFARKHPTFSAKQNQPLGA